MGSNKFVEFIFCLIMMLYEMQTFTSNFVYVARTQMNIVQKLYYKNLPV